jgi:hypothetical protein
MNVGQLKEQLRGIDDSVEVVIDDHDGWASCAEVDLTPAVRRYHDPPMWCLDTDGPCEIVLVFS